MVDYLTSDKIMGVRFPHGAHLLILKIKQNTLRVLLFLREKGLIARIELTFYPYEGYVLTVKLY